MTAILLPSPHTSQIVIDVELPVDLLNLDKKIQRKLPGALRRIALEGKSFWKAEAGRRLKSSRKAYQDSIDYQMVDNVSFYYVLEGFLPYSVEYGNKGFDMKP